MKKPLIHLPTETTYMSNQNSSIHRYLHDQLCTNTCFLWIFAHFANCVLISSHCFKDTASFTISMQKYVLWCHRDSFLQLLANCALQQRYIKGQKTALIIVTLQFGEHVPLCHYSYASVYYIYGLIANNLLPYGHKFPRVIKFRSFRGHQPNHEK